MLLSILLILSKVTIQGALTEDDAERWTEKRLLLHSDDDIATELMTLKAELTTTTNSLTTVLAEVSTLTQEVNALKLSQQNAVHGAVYTRWGRNTCPNGAELVYYGYIAGKHYNKHGSGSDNLCLPFHPTWGNYTDGFDGVKASIYGTEIDVINPNNIFPYSVWENDMPCAVCKSIRRTSIMVPARTTCYPGWTLEYTGYLATAMDAQNHESYDTLCLDSLPEFVPHGEKNDNEHILYLVEAHCGSLPCPPYVDGRELACAVCTI